MSYEAPGKLDGERGILSELRKVAEELKALAGGRSNVRALRPGTIAAQPGEITRAQANQVVLLPAAKAAQGAGATVLVESQPVTIRTSDRSSINGVASGAVVVTTLGTVECRSTGLGWWTGAAGGPGGAGAPVDAEYLVGAASAGLTNERVATDSTEIDVDLATPGVASWALRVASVVFAKLQDLTGLSILGRASNSDGVMAAITATAGGQYARSNAPGTALEFGNPASTSIANTSGQLQRAALTGAIAAAQNGNATLFAGIRDNGSAENDRTNLNHLSTTSVIAVVTDDAGNDELEITHERAALTGFATASQNSNATSSAEPIVTYSASANMTNERVTTSSTSVAVSTAVAGQIEFQRAALTGAVAAGANGNGTVFSGIRDNGTLESPGRTNLNFLSTNDIVLAVAQDVGNDELEVTASLAAGTTQVVSSGGTVHDVSLAAGVKVLNVSTNDATLTGFARAVTGNVDGDRFWVRTNDGIQAKLAHATGSSANNQISSPEADDFDLSGRGMVELRYEGTSWRVIAPRQPYSSANAVALASVTGAQGVINISALQCGGNVSVSSSSGVFSIGGFTAKPTGFWFDFIDRRSTASHVGTLLENDGNTTTSIRTPDNAGVDFTNGYSTRLVYNNSRWRVQTPASFQFREALLDESLVVLRDTFPTTHGTGSSVSGYSTLGWTFDTAGVGSINPRNGEAGHPGILRIVTGTTSTADRYMFLPTAAGATGGPFVLDDVYGFQWIFRVTATGTGTFVLKIGLGDNAASTTLGSNSLYFTNPGGFTSNWYAESRVSGSVVESDDTGVASGTTLWVMATMVKADSGDWTWDVNGVASGTIPAADIPTGVAMTPVVHIDDQDATNAITVDVDEFTIVFQPSGTRHT